MLLIIIFVVNKICLEVWNIGDMFIENYSNKEIRLISFFPFSLIQIFHNALITMFSPNLLKDWKSIDRFIHCGASLVAQTVKNLPLVQETWVQSLGWENPLEKRKTIHSSILAWRIPWTGEPGWATVHGVAKIWTQLSYFHFPFWIKHTKEVRGKSQCCIPSNHNKSYKYCWDARKHKYSFKA